MRRLHLALSAILLAGCAGWERFDGAERDWLTLRPRWVRVTLTDGSERVAWLRSTEAAALVLLEDGTTTHLDRSRVRHIDLGATDQRSWPPRWWRRAPIWLRGVIAGGTVIVSLVLFYPQFGLVWQLGVALGL